MSSAAPPHQDLLDALTRHNIPHYPNVESLGFVISPHGIPYIPLPAPHAAYSLTNYLPTLDLDSQPGSEVEDDPHALTRLLRIPSIASGLARTKYEEPTVEDYIKRIKAYLETPQTGWCTGGELRSAPCAKNESARRLIRLHKGD